MKSNVKKLRSFLSNHLELVTAIYRDACSCCIAEVSDYRDLKTIRSRVENEGISFLTITMPGFSEDFEKSLADGQIAPTSFSRFRKVKGGVIPSFLAGLTELIFDRETGRIKNENEMETISASTIVASVRQLCRSFQRIELPCAPQRVQEKLDNFIKTEHAFKENSISEEDFSYFKEVSCNLWYPELANICLSQLLPKHGPGATAERILGNSKYVWRIWHERLEPFFPFLETAYSISAVGSREFEDVSFVSPELELPVRVVTVPKTLKGPRIIAIEPVCMQYTQQAIRNLLYEVLESSIAAGGRINFRDQSINQRLALTSSKDGQLATIDLSDASDRVPRDLALEMFDGNRDLADAIDACRTKSAQMPDGTLITPLGKFASMGSALCFPVESMYFYTICVGALLAGQNLPVTRGNCLAVSQLVHVYGDDLIVPTTYANTVFDHLQKYNCKVNTSKSFWTGKFRESCGLDAYNGEPVTPVYLRKQRPENRQKVQELISWVATANLFYLNGYWRTASHMYTVCETILGELPFVAPECSALGRISYLGYRTANRWNYKYQRLEVKAWVPSPVYRSDMIEGYAALQKCLLSLEASEPPVMETQTSLLSVLRERSKGRLLPTTVDREHLKRSARHGAVAIKRRWVPA